jgi:hypothetical protein
VLVANGKGLAIVIVISSAALKAKAVIAQIEEGAAAIAVERVVVEASRVGSTLEHLAARVEPEDIEGVEEDGRQSEGLTAVALFVEEGVTASSVEGVPTDCAQGKGSRGSEEA